MVEHKRYLYVNHLLTTVSISTYPKKKVYKYIPKK